MKSTTNQAEGDLPAWVHFDIAGLEEEGISLNERLSELIELGYLPVFMDGMSCYCMRANLL
ncbi:hypothetical protein LLE49_11335 [Alicyclobacillus tolerans]|uniref:hypothetical protein n=1 Tax=Alicyclobacillus tolerans TaxID=90970 RepID=UPI001F374C51|nr:hypothetical protein [Alicyclobacillus tolerans]MCF8565309.1 hypothetical protein [Alicyclobacillus tolerans]